jgi:D-amino peptidase
VGKGTGITVNDAHGPMRNILPELLHPAARLIRGKPKPMGMLAGLDGSHDAVICVGYHARAGALGVLSHSFMGHEIDDIWLNGRPAGEIGLAQATAAALGVPVAALSGDDAACAEMAAWDRAVTTVAVKHAVDRFAAELRPVQEARAAITDGVADGLRTLRGDAVLRRPGTGPPRCGPDPRMAAGRTGGHRHAGHHVGWCRP